jgi:cobalt-zinc-cadmium resistance protein CzcA
VVEEIVAERVLDDGPRDFAGAFAEVIPAIQADERVRRVEFLGAVRAPRGVAFLDRRVRIRIVVVVVALIALAAGLDATRKLSVDAFPDVTNIQVQVATEVPGRSPDEVERIVTIPVEIGMTGLPGLTELRSQNEPGLSIVTMVFTDKTPVYFARQLVGERLDEVRTRLPAGINPILGPVSNALSEVYQYTIEHPNDGKRALSKEELIERRIIQDWVARPLLRSISGVAEINSTGGYVKQYQVQPDPTKLLAYGLSFADLIEALEKNNVSTGAGYVEHKGESYLVRAAGRLESPEQIGEVAIGRRDGAPIRVADVATIAIGKELRTGSASENGEEVVVGTALMLIGANSRSVAQAVDAKMVEIRRSLPAVGCRDQTGPMLHQD